MSQLGGNEGEVEITPLSDVRLSWDVFVSEVIRLTVLAFYHMEQGGVAKFGWPEDTFTVSLGLNYLQQVIRDEESPIDARIQVPVITPAILSGQKPVKSARIMDMVLLGNWKREASDHKFVWEAKRVADTKKLPTHQSLDSEYVNEGIYRFINNAYAENIADAGILGYVLVGDPPDIVKRINASMGRITKRTALTIADNLILDSPVCDHSHIYKSQHTRIDSTQIRLHHLFLPFTF